MVRHCCERYVEKSLRVTNNIGVGFNFYPQNLFAHIWQIEKRPISVTVICGQHSIKMEIVHLHTHSSEEKNVVLDIMTYESNSLDGNGTSSSFGPAPLRIS